MSPDEHARRIAALASLDTGVGRQPGSTVDVAPSLDADSLGILLTFLGRGSHDPGAFERVRWRLVKFFRWKGVRGSEALADDVLDRVARKLVAGERIVNQDPITYVLGVARLVYLEAVKREVRERTQLQHAAIYDDEPDEPTMDREMRLRALENCLHKLTDQSRRLALEYHREGGASGIERRKELAEELGVAMNALRIRVHRLRQRLSRCIETELKRNESAGNATLSGDRRS